MKIVVVAGGARKVGKTSVAAGLMRALPGLGWTAVKISTHAPAAIHGACGAARDFELREETVPANSTDTGRFLAAGARRAFWLRATPAALPAGLAALFEAVGGADHVLLESSSAMDWIRPRLGIVVCHSARRATKPLAKRLLLQADALVAVGPARRVHRPLPVRTFTMVRKDAFHPALARFVRAALRRMGDSQIRSEAKEVPWPQ